MELLDMLREFGGLGIAGYLIFWLTRKLNGKLDRLAAAVEKGAANHEDLTRAIRENTTVQRQMLRRLAQAG